jgi:tRNA(His) 5'-end guanylyltransferase
MKKDKNMKTTIADRCKELEKSFDYKLKENLIIRIDGHKFSKYTKGMKKPFDNIFSETMINTTKDLVERFGASTGYTQSDEITLIIPEVKDNQNQIFAGRVQKIVSLVSSYTTMRFNKHFEVAVMLEKETNNESYVETMKQKIGNAWFDARIYSGDRIQVFESILFRTKDANRNAKSMFASTYCSHKSLLNKNADEQIEFCKEETHKDFNDIRMFQKWGIFIKRTQYLKEVENCLEVKRSKIVTFCETFIDMDTETYSEKADMILNKYLEEI